jgi:hypothetical protein
MKMTFKLWRTGDSREKLYVLVKNYRLINEDVEICRTEEEAFKAFEKYTGFSFFNKNYTDPGSEQFSPDYAETRIFELALPDFLEFHREDYER